MPPPMVQWMTRVDHLVLELLDEQGIALPPTAITLALEEEHGINAPSNSQVARRLREDLSYHGLVEQPYRERVRGYYLITDLGRRYLHDSDAEPAEFVADIDDKDE
jgi:DNA-binding PadR family transcriptional regulator